MSIYRTLGGEGDLLIRSTGDADQDNANMAICVAELSSQGYGTLWIEGDVYTTGGHSFGAAPIKVKGAGGRGRILHSGTGSVFTWSLTGIPSTPSAAHYDIEVTNAGDDYFTTSAFTPVSGQYVILYSEDELPQYPHFGVTGAQKPGSFHIIERWDESTGKAYVEGPIGDEMTTSGKAYVIESLLDDVEVADLVFEFVGDVQNDYAYSLLFYGVNNLRVHGVRMARYSASGIYLKCAMNPRIHDFVIDGSYRADGVYGVVATFTNGLLMSNFQCTGTRHAITTGSGMTSGTSRYGGPINTVVENGIFKNPLKYAEPWDAETDYEWTAAGAPWVVHNGSLWKAQSNPSVGDEPGVAASWGSAQSYTRIPVDTHAEGINTTFRNITVVSDLGSYCASTRARGTKYQNCTFRGKGEGVTYGVLVYGPDTTIEGCVFENVLTPVCVPHIVSEWLSLYDYATGAVVRYENAIYRATSNPSPGDVPGVAGAWTLAADESTYLSWQKELIVSHNTFRNCRGTLRLDAGTGHQLMGNTFFRCGRLAGGQPLYSQSLVSLQSGTGHNVMGNQMVKDPSFGIRTVDMWDLDTGDVTIVGNSLSGFATTLDPTQPSMCIGRLLDAVVPDHTTEMFYYPNHGLEAGDWGYFGVLSGGVLPTGITTAQYFIVMTGVANQTDYFKVSLSYGGAVASFTDNGTYQSATTGAPLLLFRGVAPSLDATYEGKNMLMA